MSSNLGLGFSEFNLRMEKPPVKQIYEFEDFRVGVLAIGRISRIPATTELPTLTL